MKLVKRHKVICTLSFLLMLGLFFVTIHCMNTTPKVLKSSISPADLPTYTSQIDAISVFFENYEQANSYCDAIVIGNIEKVHAPQELISGEATNRLTGEKETLTDIFTVSDIQVSKVIKGNVSPGETIQVKQYGGLFNGIEHRIDGIEFFKQGERHIFFLRGFKNKSPYSCINDTQGDILIVDGKVLANNKVKFVNDNVREDDLVKVLKEKVEQIKKGIK